MDINTYLGYFLYLAGVVLIVWGIIGYYNEKIKSKAEKKEAAKLGAEGAITLEDIEKLIKQVLKLLEVFAKLNTNVQFVVLGLVCIFFGYQLTS